jgi:opacity protein-like surface antigen
MTIDLYVAADFSKWLAVYGNIGLVGRLSTYPEQKRLEKNYRKQDAISVGGGIQVTLVSHIVIGFGYNGLVSTGDTPDDPTYHTIRSVVGQLGWRF